MLAVLRGLVDGTGLELGDGRRLLPGKAEKNDENDGVIRIHDQVCFIIIIIVFNCLFFLECFFNVIIYYVLK